MDVLFVDGYNIIGAWPELERLKKQNISIARDKLIEVLSEYQAYYRRRVIVVYDALYVKGQESRLAIQNVDVIYTKEDETADECIERLVKEFKTVLNQVYVATSDYLEQRTIFSRGALRISAHELKVQIQDMADQVQTHVIENVQTKPKNSLDISEELAIKLEKMRRGKS